MKVSDVMSIMDAFAPQHLAESWDNPGLAIGDPEAEVHKILLALTPTLQVFEAAQARGADMVVTHHPFIFKGLKTLRTDRAAGRAADFCIRHGIAVFCAHTNLDIARGGVNDVLADRLGLVNVRDFVVTETVPSVKLVTFVPPDHAESLKQALFAAGAGSQGNYDACCWQTEGRGQFRPNAAAHPYLGRVYQVEQTPETRLEVLVDDDKLAAVLAAFRAAHPYEEPAFDILHNHGFVRRESIGRVGDLPQALPLGTWLEEVKQSLDLPLLRYTGPADRMIRTVACCGGSAAEYLADAARCGADCYVTGDTKYHNAQAALEMGLALVDVGHFGGERPVLEKVRDLLVDQAAGTQVEIWEEEKDFYEIL